MVKLGRTARTRYQYSEEELVALSVAELKSGRIHPANIPYRLKENGFKGAEADRLLRRIMKSAEMEQLLTTSNPETAQHLGDLALALAQIEAATSLAQASVDKAREAGVSWREIGDIAGVSPQAAQQRWSEEGRRKNAERQRRLRSGT